MADLANRIGRNAPGRYYVDSGCVNCDLCRWYAPDNFKVSEDEGYAFVFKQPENAQEERLCWELMESCPVEGIGDDGEAIEKAPENLMHALRPKGDRATPTTGC
jgi:ferredoxin